MHRAASPREGDVVSREGESGGSEPRTLAERDRQVILRPWLDDDPVSVVKARGCTITDDSGNEYLDFTSGYFVNQAGHGHPRIVEAATEQMRRVMQVSGRHTTPAQVDLAERIVQLTPASIDRVLFATGGSEANEYALKMVRQRQGSSEVAFVENGFHGLTLGALEVSSCPSYRKTAGVALGERSYPIPSPYCYRCPYAEDCQTQCLDGVGAQFASHPQTTALIAEPMQGVGGIIPPDRWWDRLDRIRRAHGLLLILDEVQTGLGRTGKLFAAEHYGLEPDLLTAGKGLSGGVGSLSVVACSEEVAEGFDGGTTPTSGGNAVAAAAGLALVDVILEEGMVENSARMGRYLAEQVEALDDPWVGDIRFCGLFGGIELVLDRQTREIPPTPVIRAVCRALREAGMLITTSGPYGNVLRIQPPLCIQAEEIDRFLLALEQALTTVRERTGHNGRFSAPG